MLDLLTDLPTCLSCAILRDWVSLDDTPKLDSAYCNRRRRAEYLSVVRSRELVFNNTTPSYLTHVDARKCALFWRWVVKRDVKVLCIISGWVDVSTNQFKKYLRWNGKYVRHLFVTGTVNPQLLYCSKLQSLYFDADSDVDASPLLRRNPHLRELRIDGLGNHASIFSGITLEHLNQLSIGFCEGESDCLTAVLAMCPRLQKLSIFGDKIVRALNWAPTPCPHLRSLSLELAANPYKLAGIIFPNINVVAFASCCPHIVNLKLILGGKVRDEQILGVVQRLQLRTLCLQFDSHCPLTDASLEYIAEYCGTTLELFHLDLRSECSDSEVCNFSHAALALMRARCINLHTFHCVTNTVGYYTPSQSVTVLVGKSSLSYAMTYDCSAVEILDLEWVMCNEKDFRTMCKKCPKLHTIVVTSCGKSYEEMARIVAKFPRLCLGRADVYEYDIMRAPV